MTARPVRVLVVDDNHDAADTAAQVLRIHGYLTRACYGGAEALTAADEFHPGVCVLDLNMPGMDGDELAVRLRERAAAVGEPSPGLVALTAKSDAASRARTAAAGFDRHLVKPAEVAAITGAVAAVAAGSRPDAVAAGELAATLAGLPPDLPVRFGPPGLLTFDRVVTADGEARVLFKEVAGVEYGPFPAHRGGADPAIASLRPAPR